MEGDKRLFQISGIKAQDKKRVLLKGISKLGGKYVGGSVYMRSATHLIIPQVLSSEKFLAACAAGKWVVTPDYVFDSVKNGSWLPEGPYEVAILSSTSAAFYPVRQWREKVESGRIKGAFQDWKVLLMVQEPARRAMFKRLLKAGRAEVYKSPPPVCTSITHVMAKPVTEKAKSLNAPCYPVSHIVQHLFGNTCTDMNFNKTDDTSAGAKDSFCHFADLEAELERYAIKKEGRPRMRYLEFLGYPDPYGPPSQAIVADFSNVGTMIECGLFSEALDSMRSCMFPGLLPPATFLISLLEYAQQGVTTSMFLRNLNQVMGNLLITSPPWLAQSSVKKYYAQVLQCPRCKMGMWPFLETAIRYSLSRGETCHPHPEPASPKLIRFYGDMLSLCLKLFQGELHSITSRDFLPLQPTRAPTTSTSASLTCETFWTVWERSALLSSTVKKLMHLLMEAAITESNEREKKHDMYLTNYLLELLSVLVEFWCQQHFKLNQRLVEKSIKDLSEHFAEISQDLPPAVLVALVNGVHSTRLKLIIADAFFRNLCCRNGFTLAEEPLSLKKMVHSYLPALGALAQSPCSLPHQNGPTPHSCRTKDSPGNETSPPRGLNKVNAAGETLLHRACKTNQVERVLQILALPGTDVNVKDHAGWTPLHEACNHGSTECVKALLQHRPAPLLNGQVGGVSPLHDALLNGHMDIAKMLLEYAGAVLLQQTDADGRSPLDLVSSRSQRDELVRSAQLGDSSRTSTETEVSNLSLLEAGSCLLGHLVVSYQLERGLSGLTQADNKLQDWLGRLLGALEKHPAHKLTAGWTEQRALRLAGDVGALLELRRGEHLERVPLAVKACSGENTVFLLEILQNLGSRTEALMADL